MAPYHSQFRQNGDLSHIVVAYLPEQYRLLQVDISTGRVRTFKYNEDMQLQMEAEKYISFPIKILAGSKWQIILYEQSHMQAFIADALQLLEE